jgi:hypothetical protein
MRYTLIERKQIYLKWEAALKTIEVAEIESKRFEKIGNDVFRNKYKNSFENYDDPESDDPWNEVDLYDNIIKENKLLLDKYSKQLLETCPEDFLEPYDSWCGWNNIKSCKKLVKINFFDGQEKIGYIYPWESDYSGPPYCILEINYSDHSYTTEYLNNGEWIESVELLKEET